MTESNYTRISCAHCGAPHDAKQRNRMYCSSACKLAAWKSRNPKRHAENTKAYASKVADRNAAKAACPTRTLNKARTKLLSLLKHVARIKTVRDKSIEAQAVMAVEPCAVCGKTRGYVFGRRRLYCSDACRKSTETFKASRAAHKALRKARTRGVHAEAFNPFEIFDRDGWMCKICGVPTPKSRRGTTDDDAPELDHVHPISKGGPHTRANTQCACRLCNQAKSDTVPDPEGRVKP